MKTLLIKTKRKLSVALALAVVAGGIAGVTAAKESGAPPKVTVSDKPIDRNGRVTSYANVVKKVAPSVVNIYSTRTIQMQSNPFLDDPLFRRFFGDDSGSGQRRSRPQKAQGLGSGVIVSEDGYILTNNHVVEGADTDGVKVALANDKTEYTAKVVGTDPQTDVAVLKINANKLTAITLADSDQLEVGDVVFAVGNPFGVGQSVTMGIVSALGRGEMPFGHLAEYEDFIQTDASINPGNSGGALVDAEGRLVGVNQSIVSRSGGNAGVGFAIPINLARSVLERLVTDGKVTRGMLGVRLQPEISPDLAKEFQMPDGNGALVVEVTPDSPADKAGVERDDVIIEFNGKKVSDRSHLRLMVSQTPPATKVSLKVLRAGKEKALTATLGTLTEDVAENRDGDLNKGESSKADALDGAEVADLDSRTRRQAGIPPSVKGVLITRVESGSAEDEAGLKPGDVIVEINRKPVRNAEEAVELSKKAEGKRMLVRVWSGGDGGGSTRYVVVDNTKKK